jgi:protein-disulfide isomerase
MKRQKQLLVIGAGTIVVIVVAVLLVIQFRPLDVPLTDDWDTKYAELTQGYSSDGYPQLGEATAPIEVREYSSFTCPACNQLHDTDINQILEYVASGDVRIVYVPINNIGGSGADESARAGYCAAEQGKFWEMHDILFHWQELVGYSERRLKLAAEEIGMDADEFGSCLDSGETRDKIQAGMREFRERGLNSTPSVFLNGVRLENPFTLAEDVANRVGGTS